MVTRENEWLIRLTADEILEIETAAEPLISPDFNIGLMTRADFDLPTLGAKLTALRQELLTGRGFLLLRGLPVAKYSEREGDIKVTADVNISAFAAKQKINGFVLSEISYMMHAGDPTLVVDEHICWRVPVILSLTSRGDVGEAGTIDVDVETGRLHVTPQLIAEINSCAKGLTLSTAPSSAAPRGSE